MPPLSIMLKPASGACNMRCRYCFYADEMALREKPLRGMMSHETLENVIRKVLETAEGSCAFSFQGGEPTLAGLDFFREVVALERRYNTRGLEVHNALQTNGLLIDGAWAQFLAQNHFLVGLSLDGPKDDHDADRVDADGKGTFTRVLRAAQVLKSHGAQFNILTVVTGQNARHIQRICRFFGRNGFDYQQYINCMDPLEGDGRPPWSLSAEELGNYLCRLFDLWYANAARGQPHYDRFFFNLLQMLRGGAPESCNMMGRCNVQYLVEADGKVYPCDFYALDRWELGDLNTDSFAGLDRRREELGFIEGSLPVPEECQGCDFYPLCRNGCRRDREVLPDGSLGKNIYCAGWKRFYAYALPRLRELARRL